ncbi:hypothetical protein PENSTE_c015G05408 [Penicillium steckii]|uniref:Uncharacterized protein n=1 Tax=Penicillium steckii TaxID=303698 RepID=A0A1V6SZV9_9EURO|nr:hypothetical protein PENSTE_c015G05408 [Penicillium steckii]
MFFLEGHVQVRIGVLDARPTAVKDTFEDIGASIINLSFLNGTSKYCCGTPVIDGDNIVCPFGKDSFELDDAEILAGHAALANVTTLSASANSSSTSPCPTISSNPSSSSSGSHDVALGAGLGVPLGVIALASLAWAFMERRRANKLSRQVNNSIAPATGFIGSPISSQVPAKTVSSGPSELDAGRRMPELEARD